MSLMDGNTTFKHCIALTVYLIKRLLFWIF